jgi:hypothetical protein
MKAIGSTGRRLLGAGLLAGMLVGLLGGCSTSFTFGTPPKIDQLHQLRRGTSTSSHVRSTLGEPRGKGQAHLAVGRRTIWFYESGQAESRDVRVRWLLVFLDGDAYDGYLWFDADTKYGERHDS